MSDEVSEVGTLTPEVRLRQMEDRLADETERLVKLYDAYEQQEKEIVGLKAEIEVLIRQQIERFLLDADMVPRDEFDAVKELAANARSGQEALDKRVLNLERKLGVKVPSNTKGKAKTKKTKPKKQMKKKSSAKGKRA